MVTVSSDWHCQVFTELLHLEIKIFCGILVVERGDGHISNYHYELYCTIQADN